MRYLSTILLTGLVITELMGANVIIDPYIGLDYDEMAVYCLGCSDDDDDVGIKVWGPDNSHYEAEKVSVKPTSAPFPTYVWEKRLLNYNKHRFQ